MVPSGVKFGCLFETCLLKQAFITVNFSFRTSFATFHKFWYVIFSFSFVSGYFFNFSLMHWLVGSVFFYLIFVNFQVFLVFSWLEKLYNMISVFLNLLRLILWSNM